MDPLRSPQKRGNYHLTDFMAIFYKLFSTHKKLVIILAIITTLAIGLFIRQRILAKQKSTSYKLFTVKKQNVIKSVSSTGKVRASKQADLKFQTSGLLAWVGIKEGDYVNKWQAIAQLDRRELQKSLEKTMRDYSKQRNDFEEMYRVTYRGQKPQDALTDTAKRILEKNQWDLEKSVLDVELKDIALKLATLVSPIEGVVTHIDTPIAGVNITPATAVFTIADPNQMIFQAEIDEVDIGSIKIGQKAIVTLDAYPEEKFEGLVSKINFEAITTKGGGTAFKIEITLPENDNLRFKIGLNGDVQIVIGEKEDVLVVPGEAIFYKEGESFVRVIKNNKPLEVEISIGVETEEFIEISKGVEENQKIIVSEKK